MSKPHALNLRWKLSALGASIDVLSREVRFLAMALQDRKRVPAWLSQVRDGLLEQVAQAQSAYAELSAEVPSPADLGQPGQLMKPAHGWPAEQRKSGALERSYLGGDPRKGRPAAAATEWHEAGKPTIEIPVEVLPPSGTEAG